VAVPPEGVGSRLDQIIRMARYELLPIVGHATYLDRRNLTDEVVISERDAATDLIFMKGLEHEARYLASVKARGFAVIEMAGEGSTFPNEQD
jgi:hypothetical protein